MKSSLRSLMALTFFAQAFPAFLRAQNLPVNGNLTVSGTISSVGSIDSDSNTLTFGTQGGSFGAALLYQDAVADTLTFAINRTPGSWLWQHLTNVAAMRLDSTHQLILYQSNGTTAGITLTPASSSLKLGTHANGTLTADSNGVITAAGGFSVAGNFTNSNGSFAGGSTGLTLNAGGTNQSITLNSSGGDLIFKASGTERARITAAGNLGLGTTAPLTHLHVNGGGDQEISISSTDTNGRRWSMQSSGAVANVGRFQIIDRTAVASRLTIDAAGNVGIGTTAPAGKLEVNGGSLLVKSSNPSHGSMSLQPGGPGYAGYIDWYREGPTRVAYMGFQDFEGSQNNFGLNLENGANFIIGGGNVGIGTASPATKLHVAGDNAEISLGRYTADGRAYTRLGMTTSYDTYWASNATYNGSTWAYVNTGGWGGRASRIDQADGAITLDTVAGGTDPIIWNTRLKIDNAGNVGIGTTNPTHKLAVNGTVRAKEVIVDTDWADYVFDEDYRLAPLSEVESHIKKAKHLPGVPSAAEVAEHGVSMGEMQATLLSKIEELTLHLIAQEKLMHSQQREIATLHRRIAELATATGR